ncbi:MAG: hypothetical protein QM589_08960 [Thermomicrobiales bacterium]
MTSMLVNVIVAFWILLFGAMAIVPFMLDGKPHARSNETAAPARTEDRVISIRPVALARPEDRGVQAPGQVPASILAAASARAQASHDDHSGHRHAA